MFFFPAVNNLDLLKWGIFAAGFLTVAQFSFWGNYLPRVYPVHLRRDGGELRRERGWPYIWHVGRRGDPHDRWIRVA